MEKTIAEGGGVSVDVADVVLLMKLGPGRALLDEILLRKVAANLAEKQGLSISDDQVDSALGELYAEWELFEPAQVEAWLASAKIDEAFLHDYVRQSLLKDELAPQLIPDSAVQQRYIASPYDYATLHVQKIVIEGRGAAAEILLQLNEGEITWEHAATQMGNMHSEALHRKDAPPEAAAELFVCQPGGYVGPVEESLGEYGIYRVAWKDQPELDEQLTEQIRGELYDEELRNALMSDPLRFMQ